MAARVAREVELLAARRERVRERQDRLRAQLRDLEAQLRELEQRRHDLDRLLGDDRDTGHTSGPAPQLLGGAALRRRAVAHLLATGQHAEIHYRAWHDQLAADGLLIRGANPAATFLANITRSPLVARGTAPGTYRLDLEAQQRITTLLVRARKRLDALPDRQPIAGSSRRERLLALIRRLEDQQREIADCRRLAATPTPPRELGPSDGRANGDRASGHRQRGDGG